MSDREPSIEVSAPTVEEAIARGLEQLQAKQDEVEVEVIEEGSRGLFGLGAREARVRLSLKRVPSPPTTEAEAPTTLPPHPQTTVEPTSDEDEEEDRLLTVAREVVSELLEKIKVKASVSTRYDQSDETRRHPIVVADISGDDLSFLIGRKSEVVNALQLIARLIVSKEMGHSVALVVDVEGHRQRQEARLRRIARQMAKQAVETGRRQILEPMPANERRIIHLELRDHPQVTTESIGEGSRRKVTIIPKTDT